MMATNRRAAKTSERVESARRHLARVEKEAAIALQNAKDFLAEAERAHREALETGWE